MPTVNVELRNVTKRFGDFVAVDNVSLQIHEGEFFSLLGPSGCGKTTNLRMIAGFELPSEGEIYLKGHPVGQLPPFKRNVNTVFQNYALFPHMTVAENVGFGLEMKKLSKSEINQRVNETLDLVRLPNLGSRKPRQLSGGQQQRVALARAIVNRPDVLLLDEPLSALDLKLRKTMQFELKELQRQLGITFIFVTHDQEESMTMSDRIAVMDHGHVLQVGAPTDIYEQPNSRFVADFIGETNFLPCKVTGRENGLATVVVGDKIKLQAACEPNVAAGDEASLIIRPEKINIHTEQQSNGQNHTVLPGEIVEKVYIGTDTRFAVKLMDGSVVNVRHQNMSMNDPVTQVNNNETVFVSWQTAAARVLTS
ncbi:MAG TPA: ABC transporter ATP-binding protein [Anaerolineae bacterium]|nr:ABC transporter ATP-binding protein [Anaerolineae bacterium]MCB0179898.1 ABC transporter ATP-binding protein [Anaerolineae bacterium]MCB0224937.1 ABC transporter ATP-binding protein [Anaerolineae bacterium]MCB9104610.1 ABC transporter ATP-binding protein [Anaerolineales bacterium]HRV92865.1 ABC transporter ATP-binding protein [Anaerolineae bacterium]